MQSTTDAVDSARATVHGASTTNEPELWNEGDLRSTRLGVNSFPDGEATLPDELFLAVPDGEIAVIRQLGRYGVETWAVFDGEDEVESGYEAFGDAFAHALALVRQEVEDA
ncbi:MAG: hypothetical protein ACOC42_00920 [Halobacteriota archaeon]